MFQDPPVSTFRTPIKAVRLVTMCKVSVEPHLPAPSDGGVSRVFLLLQIECSPSELKEAACL